MNQPAYQQSSESNSTEMPVGEILRRTRLHYNRSIEDVEAALRIQAKQIHAIEVGDMSAFPARVYAIGFVRTYAEYLGLDGDKIIELFKQQTEGKSKAPDLKLPDSREPDQTPPVGIAVALFALLCLILIVSFSFSGEKSEEPEIIPEVPQELTVTALKEKQEVVVREPEPEPEPVVEEKPKGIILKMLQNSWIEIRDQNNRKLISRVLKAGDQYFVPDRLDLRISIGNAGGVEIQVDGEPLQNLGGEGQVLRNIPLNAEVLKQRFPKQVENSDKKQ